MQNLFLTSFISFAMIGCSATTQTTSGRDYLSRYSSPIQAQNLNGGDNTDIDSQVRQIAAIEPNLSFPARIGIARIERGQLASVPEVEMLVWAKVADHFGPKFGQFIPVSPLIAQMVRPHETQNNAVDDIRRGAARQHIDYVLVYEVLNRQETQKNLLSIADISVIGLFILPSRNMKIEATASAILLDVRNGYPYGTASGFADKTSISQLVYAVGNQENLANKANIAAVTDLGDEVETMFQQLLIELADKQS